jgi:cholesterol oxidase
LAIVSEQEPQYDFAVIGSGFGGSVAALRLSQKGYSVLLIEEGRRWKPEEFPTSTWENASYWWKPFLGWFGIQRLELFRHGAILGGAGVGGGSLVWGNTLYEPLDSFYEEPIIRALGGQAGLKPYVELAHKMMGTTTNPHRSLSDDVMGAVSAQQGCNKTYRQSPVAVCFDSDGSDPYFGGEGPERQACTLCGGCFLGCRFGAKNTLETNYLYFAERLGCEILPGRRVDGIRPLSDDGAAGYELELVDSLRRRGGETRMVRVSAVVCAAGVVGTAKLLGAAKAKGELPNLPDTLGHGVRTNSESLVAVRVPGADYSEGIAASSSVFLDEHTQVQLDRYPAGSDALAALCMVMTEGGGRLPRPLKLLWALLRHPIRSIRSMWPKNFAKETMILVVMQDLDSSLRFRTRRRWWWPFGLSLGTEAGEGLAVPTYIPKANAFARELAAHTGGYPLSSVFESTLDMATTAHVMGGCPIGLDPSEGVVDTEQRVFGYQNLWVCDGSVVPVNLGVNPTLAILALSERAMGGIAPKAGECTLFGFEKTWGVGGLFRRWEDDAEAS